MVTVAHANGDIWETVGNEDQRTDFDRRGAMRGGLWLTACKERGREKKKGPNTALKTMSISKAT